MKDYNGGGYHGGSQNSHPIYGINAAHSLAPFSERRQSALKIFLSMVVHVLALPSECSSSEVYPYVCVFRSKSGGTSFPPALISL